MTIQELVNFCNKNNISLDTQLAVRSKDDYFLTKDAVYLDRAYFGNSQAGSDWEKNVAKVDDDGDIDYDSVPDVLILDSFSG